MNTQHCLVEGKNGYFDVCVSPYQTFQFQIQDIIVLPDHIFTLSQKISTFFVFYQMQTFYRYFCNQIYKYKKIDSEG